MLLAEMLGEVIGITSDESTVIDFGVKWLQAEVPKCSDL